MIHFFKRLFRFTDEEKPETCPLHQPLFDQALSEELPSITAGFDTSLVGDDSVEWTTEPIPSAEEIQLTPIATSIIPSGSSSDDPISVDASSTPLEETPESLSDNKAYIGLIEQNCDLIKEFERYLPRMTSEESRELLQLMLPRLREAMYLAGATPIEGDADYDSLRHIPDPMTVVKEGAPIEETIQPGVAIGNRVFVRAQVRLK